MSGKLSPVLGDVQTWGLSKRSPLHWALDADDVQLGASSIKNPYRFRWVDGEFLPGPVVSGMSETDKNTLYLNVWRRDDPFSFSRRELNPRLSLYIG